MKKFLLLTLLSMSSMAFVSQQALGNIQNPEIKSLEEWHSYATDANIQTIDLTKGFKKAKKVDGVNLTKLDEIRKENEHLYDIKLTNETVLQPTNVNVEQSLIAESVKPQLIEVVAKPNGETLFKPISEFTYKNADNETFIDFVALTRAKEGAPKSQIVENQIVDKVVDKQTVHQVSEVKSVGKNYTIFETPMETVQEKANENGYFSAAAVNETKEKNVEITTTTNESVTSHLTEMAEPQMISQAKPVVYSDRYYGKKKLNSKMKTESIGIADVSSNNKKVINQFDFGVSVSNKEILVDGLYKSRINPTFGINLQDTVQFKVNENVSNNLKLRGTVEYHKDDLQLNIETPIRTVTREIDNAKWLQYETTLTYFPEIKSDFGSIYPMIGIGYQRTDLGRGNKKLNSERSYMEYGLGLSKSLSPYQSLFIEGSYQKDFYVKQTTQYNNMISKQSDKNGKGDKYNVELGLKTKNTNGHDNGMTVSLYHSRYKNKNGQTVNIPTAFGNYVHQFGKKSEKETGVKVTFNF